VQETIDGGQSHSEPNGILWAEGGNATNQVRTQFKVAAYFANLEVLSILTRSHKVLNEILLEAKKQYISGQPNSISIYISDS